MGGNVFGWIASSTLTANVLTYIITSYVEWARKGIIDPPSNKNFGLWVTSSNIKLCDKSDLFSLFAALSFEGMYNDLDPCRCASPICKCTMWFWLVKLTAPPERVPVVFPFPAFSCRVSGYSKFYQNKSLMIINHQGSWSLKITNHQGSWSLMTTGHQGPWSAMTGDHRRSWTLMTTRH